MKMDRWYVAAAGFVIYVCGFQHFLRYSLADCVRCDTGYRNWLLNSIFNQHENQMILFAVGVAALVLAKIWKRAALLGIVIGVLLVLDAVIMTLVDPLGDAALKSGSLLLLVAGLLTRRDLKETQNAVPGKR